MSCLFKKFFLFLFYFSAFLCFVIATVKLPFQGDIFSFLLWSFFVTFASLVGSEVKFGKYTIFMALDISILVASYFLFGLPFLLWTNLIGSVVFYLYHRWPIKGWMVTISLQTISYTFAGWVLLHTGLHELTFPNIIFEFFLFQICHEVNSILLGDVVDSLNGNIPLKGLIKSTFHEFLVPNILELLFYPMLSLILISLAPSNTWTIPLLFIPFYGLKLVMDNIQKIQKELEKAIRAMSDILEARDEYTERHTDRVSKYASIIAKYCGMDDYALENIARIAKIHDIGKIVVRDEVLQKPGSLTKEEYEHVKLHVQYDLAGAFIPPQFAIYKLLQISRLHHERYDGEGYPFGLKGEEIPVEARIISVADAWDAMISRRVYRSGLSEEKALQILKENAGTQWDPKIVEAFFKAYEAGAVQGVQMEYKAWLKQQEWDTLKKLQQFFSIEPL